MAMEDITRKDAPPIDVEDLVSVRDFEALARERLPRVFYDYAAGAAGDEITARANEAAFREWFFLPRVLTGVSEPKRSTTLLGTPLRMPLVIAPMGNLGNYHPDAEAAVARAAGDAGILMIVSTMASLTLEEVAAAATGPLWFQLYVFKDWGITRDLIARANRAGYQAICLTVDSPRMGRRERDLRNRYQAAEGSSRNMNPYLDKLPELYGRTRDSEALPFNKRLARVRDDRLSWDDIARLREQTELPLVLKGVLSAEDAALAAKLGVDGIIVSNHGGRQLDGALPTLYALPAVVEAVRATGADMDILVDGGVRRGGDILKALALGARSAGVGRPVAWALAVGGEAGVRRLLQLMEEELELAMILCGCADAGSVPAGLLQRVRSEAASL